MSIFSDNIRFLRGKKEKTQQELANTLKLTRSRYVSYEDGRSEPPIEILIRISKFFNISIDLLVSVDIRKYPLDDILKLPDNRIVLPVMVDYEGNNFIEIVPQKASMGYLKGYADPEYIEGLQRMYLPFLTNGKYRGFLADGDSMPPFADGSCVIGEYVEKIEDLKPNKQYIFVTPDGITYKTFLAKNKTSITVSSDNSFYPSYDIAFEDLIEIWKYVRGILPQDYKPTQENVELNDIFSDLKKTMRNLENRLLR
ncbi:MAG: LexA family transcriptional regulator [Chryseobacterium sp.]|uniref:XRE family transcriptional regulator n=1 Tax=Chryseobacterium sp. TaxID=1871047 RepID=UPI0025BBD099|nr:LexA family transcriptional regulator [Chryseobacterium sp.]MCJ7934201.1 LexA family transcriptional regulator [Chryseobacterium sp.]